MYSYSSQTYMYNTFSVVMFYMEITDIRGEKSHISSCSLSWDFPIRPFLSVWDGTSEITSFTTYSLEVLFTDK